ncbi:carboxylesterase [Coxiella endosymbiont of Amblyomma sculptum]|uniref:alpha/beta hydrolase n=1 Tax=Coxiella endosymbiont of Amblyomma sculptum TaxID=2487929 RepID=UPI00132EE41A|nr:carboxylesterase [Coxiella endosymbiont of Amblyomma sculptum]QHG92394.1 carboxylesterase [Coxiella endosymbiont of Amblyomma sculptum]
MNNAVEHVTIPPIKKAVGSVIWLHGLGSNGYDFSNIIPQLVLPKDLHLRFILPHAPMRPVTINSGVQMRAWYDIYSLIDFTQEDEDGIAQAQRSVNQLIEEEISQGIPSCRIVLAGFSQGGAVALYTGLQYRNPLAGIVALSTYLPLANRIMKKKNITLHKKTPIFMAHGNSDLILPSSVGEKTFQILSQIGHFVEWHDYTMGHQVCHKEIEEIGKWLSTVFSIASSNALSKFV